MKPIKPSQRPFAEAAIRAIRRTVNFITLAVAILIVTALVINLFVFFST